jgi:hypothetical protein
VLGVSGSHARDGYSSIPEELERQLSWETELWGEYLVCPYTRRRAGEMQLVCIEAGKGVTARRRPQAVAGVAAQPRLAPDPRHPTVFLPPPSAFEQAVDTPPPANTLPRATPAPRRPPRSVRGARPAFGVP